MRASIAFFAGAGTVVAAIAVGVGGGLVMGNIMSPHPVKHQATRLEQRMSSQPLPPSNQADQPQEAQAPLPYIAASLAASGATDAVVPAASNPAPPQRQASQTQASHPAPQASQPPAPARPAGTAGSTNTAATPADGQPQPSSPYDAYAKAHDADLKRADDKRRAERRQQWMARHQQQQQHDQDQRNSDDQGWNDNRRWGDNRGWRDDRSGWRDSGSREVIVRRADRDDSASRGFGQPMRFGFPGFNLFGPD